MLMFTSPFELKQYCSIIALKSPYIDRIAFIARYHNLNSRSRIASEQNAKKTAEAHRLMCLSFVLSIINIYYLLIRFLLMLWLSFSPCFSCSLKLCQNAWFFSFFRRY